MFLSHGINNLLDSSLQCLNSLNLLCEYSILAELTTKLVCIPLSAQRNGSVWCLTKESVFFVRCCNMNYFKLAIQYNSSNVLIWMVIFVCILKICPTIEKPANLKPMCEQNINPYFRQINQWTRTTYLNGDVEGTHMYSFQFFPLAVSVVSSLRISVFVKWQKNLSNDIVPNLSISLAIFKWKTSARLTGLNLYHLC